MESSSVEDHGAPESREVSDLGKTMSRLMLSSSSTAKDSKSIDHSVSDALSYSSSAPSTSVSSSTEKVSEDVVNQVDEFLREALQNPRERLSILRMEQDIEKFIHDHAQQQLEFQQLPTSYLRLAAHRVAQHYSLHSMVLLDDTSADGCGVRIIVCKTSECRPPLIRLADIPVNLPSEGNSVGKVAIKQRPQKQSRGISNGSPNMSKPSNLRSVEERKEDYNKARARIFNSSDILSNSAIGKVDGVPRQKDNTQQGSLGFSKSGEKSKSGISEINSARASSGSTSNGNTAQIWIEKEPIRRYIPNNKVAIFRDREVDCQDPDYDRSYERYVQRFGPGFGIIGGPYVVQPVYAPVVTYNTELPQLQFVHRPQISSECLPRTFPPHLPGPWAATAPSSPARLWYGGHQESLMTPFEPNVCAPAASFRHMHSPQYPFQQHGVPFVHSHEQAYQPFLQSHPQKPDASFGLARPW